MRLADGPPDDVGLGQRRVEAAGQAERALQAVGRAEHAALALDVGQHRLAGVGHVLAEDPDALVGRHHLVQRAPDGLAEGDHLAGRRRRRPRPSGRRSGRAHHVVGDGGRVGPAARPAPRVAASATIWRASARMPSASSAVSTPPSTSACSKQHDRVVGRLVGQLLGGAVLALGVGRRVRVGPGDRGVDQRRADAGADVGDDLGRRVRAPRSSRVPSTRVDLAGPRKPAHQLGDRRRAPGRWPAPRWRSRCRRTT